MLENKFDYKVFPFTDDLNNDGIVDATWLQVKSLKMALTLGDPLKFSSFDSSYSKILDSKTYAIFKPIFNQILSAMLNPILNPLFNPILNPKFNPNIEPNIGPQH